jgi:hypothetical protein
MQVNNIDSSSVLQPSSSKKRGKNDFQNEIEKQLLSMLEKQKPEEKSTQDVEQFRKDLKSYGALAFVQKLNLEKIEKLIEQKRESLKKDLGLDDSTQPPLEGQDRLDALETLNALLEDYVKQLQDQMQAKKELENRQTHSDSLFTSLMH